MDERDRRYEDKFSAAAIAVTAALQAQEKASNERFSASEKAIEKAEKSQADYNLRSNEFRQALDDQAKLQYTRVEANTRFGTADASLEEVKSRVSELEQSRSALGGRYAANEQGQAKIALWVLGIAAIIVALGSLLVGLMKHT